MLYEYFLELDLLINFIIKQSRFLLFGLFTAFFASYGQTFFISIFNFQIRETLDLSNAQFGLLYSLATILSAIILIWFGKLIDRLDLRIYTFIISVGLAISCFLMFMIEYMPSILFVIIFGLRFFGQGAMGHASQTSMVRYYESDRGKAISFGSFGQPIGEMIFPLLAVFIMHLIGWKSVWFYCGLSLLVFYIPIYLFLLKNHNIRHNNFLKQQTVNNKNINWKSKDILKDFKFYVYLPSYLMPPFVCTGLLFYQIHIANEKGWSVELIASSYIFYGLFSIIGMIFGGPWIDKVNTRSVIPIYLVPMFVGILVLTLGNNPITIFIYMSLIAFTAGLGIPFMGSLWAELYGGLNLGAVRALLHAIGVFSTAISPFLFGLFIDWHLGISFICIFCLTLISISTLLTLIYKKI